MQSFGCRVPEDKFDYKVDAVHLKYAFKTINVDKGTLISVLTKRTESQRQAIMEECYRMKRDLAQYIHEFTYNDEERILRALVTPLPVFYTEQLKSAIKKKDSIKMIEIFTTVPSCAVKRMPEIYSEMYRNKILPNDIDSALNERYSRKDYISVLLSLAKGERDSSTDINKKQAEADAKEMRAKVIQDKWDDKNVVFKKIFLERPLPQIAETITFYETLRKKDKDFKSFENDVERGLESATEIYLTITKLAKNQPLYFAQKLRGLLKRRFMRHVNRKALDYIVRGRCDVDLEDIKTAYREKYGITLYQTIVEKITLMNTYYRTILNIIGA